MTNVKQRKKKVMPVSPGRPKGVPNKTTALIKEAIVLAAEKTGVDGEGKDGLVGYCQRLALQEPKAFASLMGRVIPVQVAGPDDEDGNPTEVVMRIVRPNS